MAKPTQNPQQDDHGEDRKHEETFVICIEQDDHGDDEQQQQQQEEQEEETFTCEICIEPVTLSNKFKNLNKCIHPFCTECMIKYIEMKLEDNQSDIKCAAPTCNHSLEPLSCRPKISQQVFERWCKALCESMMLGVDRVYCPNKECSELILDECGDRNRKRCVCPNCGKRFCFKCKVPWHDGSTCGETMDENDVAFDLLYKNNKWSKCPGCGHCVQHAGGCNFIRCRCGTSFCYKCGKQWCIDDQVGLFCCAFLLAMVIICSIGALLVK